MITQGTIASLKTIKLTVMVAELEHQLEASSTYSTLGFEELLGLLVDAEWNRSQVNKLARYIKALHFSVPSATGIL